MGSREHLPSMVRVSSLALAWFATACGSGLPDGGPVRPDPPSCGSGVPLVIGSKDYCLFKKAVNFDRAAATCSSLGAHMVFVETEAESNAIHSVLAADTPKDDIWIGLREPDKDGRWIWASGQGPLFQAWAKGEPNDANRNEDCGALEGATGTWIDADCTLERPYLCERKDAEFSCTGKRLKTDRGDYCLYASGHTWDVAKSVCETTHGKLAELDSSLENDALRTALGGSSGVERAWLGLTDVRREGEFVWANGLPATFVNFGDGEPNDQNGEDCVEWYRPWGGKWNDIACTQERAVLCEFEK
ncbi:MAG: C-type lectin domain-containing protein [Polyangiaceae bacterium]